MKIKYIMDKIEIKFGEYCICVEETNGVLSVKAEKEDETIEEFSIELEEGAGEEDLEDLEDLENEDGEIQGFGEFEEEEDFEGADLEDLEDDEDDVKLESFHSFMSKRK